MIKNFLLVGLGGGIGSIVRYIFSLVNKHSNTFPFNTLTVNLLGSLLVGMLMGLAVRANNWGIGWNLFLITGFCGGFTTFSAFSFENFTLLQTDKTGTALLYIFTSILTGLLAAGLGFKLAS
ncbi:MAG: fluoride efflux transporter CrcB [Ferruginibacter sp.]